MVHFSYSKPFVIESSEDDETAGYVSCRFVACATQFSLKARSFTLLMQS